jgi:hypothetical protein
VLRRLQVEVCPAQLTPALRLGDAGQGTLPTGSRLSALAHEPTQTNDRIEAHRLRNRVCPFRPLANRRRADALLVPQRIPSTRRVRLCLLCHNSNSDQGRVSIPPVEVALGEGRRARRAHGAGGWLHGVS